MCVCVYINKFLTDFLAVWITVRTGHENTLQNPKKEKNSPNWPLSLSLSPSSLH